MSHIASPAGEINPNCAPFYKAGSISGAVYAGVPQILVLPIRPWNAPDERGKNAGKAPARAVDDNTWCNLSGWRHGNIAFDVLDYANSRGANCGLLLGCPVPDGESDCTYAAIDIDLVEGSEVHRARFLDAFHEVLGDGAYIVRETIPYRALLLVKVAGTEAGRKSTYNLTWKAASDAEPVSVGKIELLTTGQQCVIGGTHRSGNKIRWVVPGTAGKYDDLPIANIGKRISTFGKLEEVIDRVLAGMEQHNYQHTATKSNEGEPVEDNDLCPEWVTPALLCETLARMGNYTDTDREVYVEVMHAASATMHGIKARKGITGTEESMIAMAAAAWAAKWPKAGPDKLEEELSKWRDDFGRYPIGGFRTSWRRLISLASQLGYPDAVSDDAARQFKGDPRPAAANDDEPEGTSDATKGEVPATTDGSEVSDFVIARCIYHEYGFSQNATYVAGLKQWLVWQDTGGWIGGPTAEHQVRTDLRNHLTTYTNQRGNEWLKSEKNKVQSEKMVSTQVKLLADRTAKSPNTINDAVRHLQTPEGMYDLQSLAKISDKQRKPMFDCRYTGVSPSEGIAPTPKFDSVVMHLCDGNDEVANWFWHYLGYSLIGTADANCFVVLWGPGGNGRSTFFKVMAHILGGYYTELNARVLTQAGKDDHPTALNALRYRRFAATSEIDKADRWNEAQLKRITGGGVIQARGMRENESGFRNEVALFIACNETPNFSGAPIAIQRRLRLIGTTKAPEKVVDGYADLIITQEAPAILYKLMILAQQVIHNGGLPAVPVAITIDSAELLEDGNPIFAWVTKGYDFGPKYAACEMGYAELKKSYDEWVQKHPAGIGFDALSENKFTRALHKLGVSTRDNSRNPLQRDGARIVKGIRLKPKPAGG